MRRTGNPARCIVNTVVGNERILPRTIASVSLPGPHWIETDLHRQQYHRHSSHNDRYRHKNTTSTVVDGLFFSTSSIQVDHLENDEENDQGDNDRNDDDDDASADAASSGADNDSNDGSTEKKSNRLKRRRPRFRPRNVPLLDEEKAGQVFDEIAPFLTYKEIRSITGKLNKKPRKWTRMNTRILGLWKNSKFLVPLFVQQRLATAIAGKTFDEADVKAALEEPDFTPCANRVELERHIQTLRYSRELAVRNPLLWSRREKRRFLNDYRAITRNAAAEEGEESTDATPKTRSANLKQAREYYAKQLLEVHSEKSSDTLDEEAREIAEFLADHLPPPLFEDVMSLLTEVNLCSSETNPSGDADSGHGEDAVGISDSLSDTVDNESNTGNHIVIPDSFPNRPMVRSGLHMRMLLPNLYNTTKSHVHLIAPKMAEFFYVKVPHDEPADSHLPKAEAQWQNLRNKFVEALLYFQHELQELKPELREEATARASEVQEAIVESLGIDSMPSVLAKERAALDNGDDDEDDEDKETDNDNSNNNNDGNNGNDTTTTNNNNNNNNQEEFLLKPGTDPVSHTIPEDELSSYPANRKERKVRRRTFHIALQATNLTELSDQDLYPTNRMVFVDNLPIDVTEAELYDLFSRCGVLEKVQVFNQRLDLDPGIRAARIARQTKYRLVAGRRKWFRPKTPLYGALTFASEEDCATALDPTMRLFGMIIRRHAARTVRPSDLTKLYIENIPTGLSPSTVQERVREALQPDVVVGSERTYNDKYFPTSCEVEFESFEVALDSFGKVEQAAKSLLTSTSSTPSLDLGGTNATSSSSVLDLLGSMDLDETVDNENDRDKNESGAAPVADDNGDETNTKKKKKGKKKTDKSDGDKGNDEEKGKNEAEEDPIVVNWFRTPPDAMKYWTREQTFE